MNLAPAILGSTAVKQLQENQTGAVIVIGSDLLTRGQLAAVGCFNFLAARRLGAILSDQFQVPNLRYVYDKVPPPSLVVPRLGVFSLAVLGACFEAKNLGTLETYVAKHRAEGVRQVSFPSMKHQEAQEAAREAKEKRRRQRQRRDQAHQLRVARFDERQQTV